jgi:DNA polymerase III sliding clamp (beta) subunit (PCNA family)
MIRVLQENLNTALSIVKAGITERSRTLPILDNVLMDCGTDGMVTLTTNDLETVIQYQIGCKVEGDSFAITLPCKLLAEAVGELHNDVVDITHYMGECKRMITTLKCNRQTLNLYGIEAQDYPPLPKTEGQSIVIYDLAEAIKKVKDLLTTDKDYSIRNTEGLLFDLDKGLVVATDRKRMKITHINTTAPGVTFRISKKAATMLLKVKDTVNVTYQPPDTEGRNSHIKFESGKMTIITQNLESNSKYPDYQKVAETHKDLVEVY